MQIFGIIMILAVIQLFGVGSVIQRGKLSWIPEFLLSERITDTNGYCRAIGNKLILLSLIALGCGIGSFTVQEFSITPIVIFGAGILLTIVLTLNEYKKYTRK